MKSRSRSSQSVRLLLNTKSLY